MWTFRCMGCVANRSRSGYKRTSRWEEVVSGHGPTDQWLASANQLCCNQPQPLPNVEAWHKSFLIRAPRTKDTSITTLYSAHIQPNEKALANTCVIIITLRRWHLPFCCIVCTECSNNIVNEWAMNGATCTRPPSCSAAFVSIEAVTL